MLESWNETPVKKKIIDWVEKVTKEGDSDFIPQSERIAVFDNDGTLWTEFPLQIQILFAMDRLKEITDEKPEMKEQQPFKALLEKDMKTISTFTKKDLMTFMETTHVGRTPDDFMKIVKDWFDKTDHPKVKASMYKCFYAPQKELLDYLRSKGFKTFIVSGGGLIFMRVIAEQLYGIPSEQVIGSSGKTKVVYEGTKPVVTRLAELLSFDDRDEKINNINLHIGKVPVLVFGNSDGDLAMMRYALHGKHKAIALLLHHDDAERESAYDRDFKLSPLKEALDVAGAEDINIVSMKNDWKKVF